MKARKYQVEIVNTVVDYLLNHEGNPVVASPTGTGKTAAFCYLLKALAEMAPDLKAIVVTHDQRIIAQNAKAMSRIAPEITTGIYSSGLGIKETWAQVTFAGVQSIYKKFSEFGEVNVLIIDEAHMVSDRENTMYQKLVRGLKEANESIRVIGFSGTPYRMKTGLITEGELFDKIVIDFTKTEKFNWFVTEGYLCRLVTKATEAAIDVTQVSMRGGDFDEHELQAVTDTDELNLKIVNEVLSYGKDREHWLGYSTGVKHAERMRDVFRKKGVVAEVISAETPDGDEDTPGTQGNILKLFRSGEIRCLINVGMLTTGYDFPSLDLIFVARATQSPGLWVQILGRGTRPDYAPGLPLTTAEERLKAIAVSSKKNCLILDFASNTLRLGPINDPLVPLPRKKGAPVVGMAPVKTCPQCKSLNHTRAVYCVDCGFEFPPPSTVKGHAGSHEVMTDLPVQDAIYDFDVNHVIYDAKVTKSGNDAIQVSYLCGATMFKKHIVFVREPYIRDKNSRWWKHHGGKLPAPLTSAEFVKRAKEITNPASVRVITNRKHPEIIGTTI